MYTLSGLSVSAGVCTAKACVITTPKSEFSKDDLQSYDCEEERQRYLKKTALFAQKLRQTINPAKDCLRDLLGAASGFISSGSNKENILTLIDNGCSAALAARSVLFNKLESFFANNNDLLTDKTELISLMNEFIHTLEHTSQREIQLPALTCDVILIAKEITPAQLLSLKTKYIKGVILEGGRDSGHLGVVLRELNIPAIFGVFNATTIKNDIKVLIDSNSSVVIVEPSNEITESLLTKQDLYQDTINDESLLNITIGCAVGAMNNEVLTGFITTHGLGLLRSEFLFLSSTTEPTEEEMTKRFGAIFTKINKNAPITARTFDFADDKKPMFTIKVDESGPLKDYGACVGTDLLKKEVRALLRASAGLNIKIVFPLVTKISEKDYLIKLSCDCQRELKEQNIKYGKMEISFMIETPAAVLLAPAFAKEGSMVIIGTSSLAEYASAPCPPDNAFTPVLAKMIVMAAKAAHEAGATLGVAGRFASRSELLPLFYKLGVTYLVTGTYNIQKIKSVVERLNLEQDLTPSFDEELYNKIMCTYSGNELDEIINRLN